jgi:hypothetical protein
MTREQIVEHVNTLKKDVDNALYSKVDKAEMMRMLDGKVNRLQAELLSEDVAELREMLVARPHQPVSGQEYAVVKVLRELLGAQAPLTQQQKGDAAARTRDRERRKWLRLAEGVQAGGGNVTETIARLQTLNNDTAAATAAATTKATTAKAAVTSAGAVAVKALQSYPSSSSSSSSSSSMSSSSLPQEGRPTSSSSSSSSSTSSLSCTCGGCRCGNGDNGNGNGNGNGTGTGNGGGGGASVSATAAASTAAMMEQHHGKLVRRIHNLGVFFVSFVSFNVLSYVLFK